MSDALAKSVGAVGSTLKQINSTKMSGGMQIQKTAELQWQMSLMQQMIQASSNVIEGCLSVTKGMISNMNR